MIEAIAASALIAIIALGVLKGLDTAQQSSGREKARSVAAALTEQDQERLRSFRAVDLANYEDSREIEVEINKVKYTVKSQVDWVRDSTGGTRVVQQQRDAGGLHADHLDHRVVADQHADPADQDVEPRGAPGRRVRHQPGHARHPGQQRCRRGRRRTCR